MPGRERYGLYPSIPTALLATKMENLAPPQRVKKETTSFIATVVKKAPGSLVISTPANAKIFARSTGMIRGSSSEDDCSASVDRTAKCCKQNLATPPITCVPIVIAPASAPPVRPLAIAVAVMFESAATHRLHV